MEPWYIVASQLNTLTPEGMATRKVRNEKIVAGQLRLAADEHVVAPDQEADERDGDERERDRACSRRSSCGEKTGMSSVMIAMPGHDHDVDGRVRVEPEEVLEQHRVAAERRVEDADVEERAPCISSSSVMPSTGVASTWMMRRRVDAPRRTAACWNQAMPGARSLWMVAMKLTPVRIEEKPRMNAADASSDRRAVPCVVRVGRVERPAGVDAAGDDGADARRSRRPRRCRS